MNFFKDGLLPEFVAGLFLYLAGILTSRFWMVLNRKTIEKKLKTKVNIALNVIYEAEEKFIGHKLGAKRLEHATSRYMELMQEKDYEKAQEQILKVFNLTTLSETGS